MITEIEQFYIDYIEDNQQFLKQFHYIYHIKYKDYLKEYYLKDYMITAYIKANKLKDYKDYTEFCNEYLKQLDEDQGQEVYDGYYESFLINMDKEVQQLKDKFNKTDQDVYLAYEIKTIWCFYNGFMIEKLIKFNIDKHTNYIATATRTAQDKQYIDDNYAIDIELLYKNYIYAIQIKSHTYLNLIAQDKQKHIVKQQRYINEYPGSKVYYILHKDNKPVYHITHGYNSYLFNHQEIMAIKKDDVYPGSYEDLTAYLQKQMKGE